MKILITGRHGQVGQCLAHVNSAHELVFLARPEIDLRAPQGLYEPVLRVRPDAILSCAALTSVDACEADVAAAFSTNAEAPGGPHRESDAPDPINVYGRSKVAGEQAVARARRYAVVRTTWIYSPFGGFLKAAREQAAATGQARVVSDQVACPTSGLDLARGLLVMAERMMTDDPSLYGVFHGAGATVARRSEVVRAAMPEARIVEVASADFFSGAARPPYSALDSSKLAEVFGVRLRGWSEAAPEAL